MLTSFIFLPIYLPGKGEDWCFFKKAANRNLTEHNLWGGTFLVLMCKAGCVCSWAQLDHLRNMIQSS